DFSSSPTRCSNSVAFSIDNCCCCKCEGSAKFCKTGPLSSGACCNASATGRRSTGGGWQTIGLPNRTSTPDCGDCNCVQTLNNDVFPAPDGPTIVVIFHLGNDLVMLFKIWTPSEE